MQNAARLPIYLGFQDVHQLSSILLGHTIFVRPGGLPLGDRDSQLAFLTDTDQVYLVISESGLEQSVPELANRRGKVSRLEAT